MVAAERVAPGVLKWLGKWYRGGVLAKDELSAARALAGDGEGLLSSMGKAEENVRKAITSALRPSKDYFSTQMVQLQRSASKFELEVGKHANEARKAEGVARGYADNLRAIEQRLAAVKPGDKDFTGLMDLKLKTQQAFNAAKTEAATSISNANAAATKGSYVKKLTNDLDQADKLLDSGDLPGAMQHLKQLNAEYADAGESVFKEMPHVKDWMNATMKNITKAPDLIKSLAFESKNLSKNKAFVKEAVRMAGKSPETYKAWMTNPANVLKIQQLKDELPAGSKLLRWLKEADEVAAGKKTAAQIVGRSPQELAQMMKIPSLAVAGTAAVVTPVIGYFASFRHEAPHLACEEAKNIAAQLPKLGASGSAIQVVNQLNASLNTVSSLANQIQTQFPQNPTQVLEVTLGKLTTAINQLYHIRDQLVAQRNKCRDPKLVDTLSRQIDQMVNDFSQRLEDFLNKAASKSTNINP